MENLELLQADIERLQNQLNRMLNLSLYNEISEFDYTSESYPVTEKTYNTYLNTYYVNLAYAWFKESLTDTESGRIQYDEDASWTALMMAGE